MTTRKPIARTTTNATVTVTLEITGVGSWGPQCTTGQVYEQARAAALRVVEDAFRGQLKRIRVVGPIGVQAITTDLEKRGVV